MHGQNSADSGCVEKKYRFPRSLRLIKSKDFGVLVYVRNEHSFGLRSRFFSVTGLKNDQVQKLRVGFTVGKKNAHRSVDRALIKRILRESVRSKFPTLKMLMKNLGMDLNVRLTANFSALSDSHCHNVSVVKKELRKDIDQLLCKMIKRLEKAT